MTKILRESLFEKSEFNKKTVNLRDEVRYYVDEEDLYDNDEFIKEIKEAIKEFGVPKNKIGVISSYSSTINLSDIKNELGRLQIEYYEFDASNKETIILLNINDLDSEKNEKDFKRQWGGGSMF